ncbi:MAG: 4-alpha-glucanotransferase [Mycobacteriaceae bacterium]|nr:4-alpha-glucanotransferase [Mycobacteriaceae bacterium]
MTSQLQPDASGPRASGSSLVELAGRYGVATRYEDANGQQIVVPDRTLVAILAALGVAAATEDDRRAALRSHDRSYWSRALPPVIVMRAGTPAPFWAHVTHGAPARLWIRLEDGAVWAGLRQLDNFTPPYDLDGRLVGEATFELPANLPLGYHRLHLDEAGAGEGAAVIVTPAALTAPDRLGARRTWGLTTQLYSVRSKKSWGVGDLTDLTDLAVWAGFRHRAGYVLVNPLHAAAPTAPMEPSPYLPTSRRFANPLYLRVEAVAEYADVRGRRGIRKLQQDVQAGAKRLDSIDRDGAWAAKRAALEQLYRVPRSAGRELAYAAFRDRAGRALDDFATWCALAEVHGSDWHRWPQDLQHPDGAGISAFATEHGDEIDFHRWLQWQLDDQLTTAQARALAAGMTLGIMHDLAVGAHPNGADAWALQDVLVLGVSAGAPPDAFNQQGQDWSQPPWRPDALMDQEYLPFRAIVNSVMRHAGGVRIDHIMGLFRLWWIPQGAKPTEGTYVYYDHDAMVGILALEAHRAGALVVGEDLGTVEPWVRDYLRERGVFGTSILWFEMDADGKPVPADEWREYCLSSVTTHDLPPTAGYLAGDHVELRDRLGLLTRSFKDELEADRAQQEAWLAELRRVGLLTDGPDGRPATEDIVVALHRYLGRTPSKLLALSLTDAVGDRRTQNQPGTTDAYPNWRVPLAGPKGRALLLEDVFRDRRAAALAAAMCAAAGGDGT